MAGRGWQISASRRAALRGHAGVTLVELMIAIALTLIIVLAVVRVFDLLGGNVTESRAILELSGRVRTIANLLQTDLGQLTVKVHPPADPLAAPGYFEIIEGIRSDRDNDGDGRVNTDPYYLTNPPTPFIVYPTGLALGAAGPRGQEAFITQPTLAELAGVLGDTDDCWMGTIRSLGEPFRGRYNGQVIESPLAEVVWWIEPVPGPPGSPPGAYGMMLVRRVMLIAPWLNILPVAGGANAVATGVNEAQFRTFLQLNDVSVRPEGSTIVANTLGDLTDRRNRFAHWPTNATSIAPQVLTANYFPYTVNFEYLLRAASQVTLPDGSLQLQPNSSDVLVNDIVGFDVRVFDPAAPVLAPAIVNPAVGYPLTPVDPGFYAAMSTLPPVGYGAYVDLGYFRAPGVPNTTLFSEFSDLPHIKSRVLGFPINPVAPRVYCTWSSRYERDGLSQDGDAVIDEGTNGVDDVSTPVSMAPDDVNESETAPPYVKPLRGVEISVRVREFSSQQIRQTSVVADFVAH